MPLKTNKQLLLLKIEASFNVDASPSASADAYLIEEPDYQIDPVVLERNFMKPTWDRTAHSIGRKLAKLKFMIEMKGGGSAGVQCRLGRALQACGFKESLHAAVVTGTATAGSATSITLAGGASAVNDFYTGLRLSLTGGTGSGQNAVITSYNGTTKVATAKFTTPPDATSLYSIEAGVTYRPSSDEADHKSATIYLYKDGLLHIMTGAFGNVSFEAAVNGFGKATFEFVGQYYAPTDAALPAAPTYESTKPQQVELAQFTVDDYAATVSKLTVDMGIEVLPRLDANGADGYNGTYIGNREPKGGIDPEAVLVASQNFWQKLSSATEQVLTFRVGSSAGNSVRVTAPKAQYTGLTYASRDRLLTLDAGLTFNGNVFGDDDIHIAIV